MGLRVSESSAFQCCLVLRKTAISAPLAPGRVGPDAPSRKAMRPGAMTSKPALPLRWAQAA